MIEKNKEQLREPSKHLDESTLDISANMCKKISEYLTEFDDYNTPALMKMLQNHIWCNNYPYITAHHTVMAHFSNFKEKFEKYSVKKESNDWIDYITKCMAFALRWNQILLNNYSSSGRSLKASLASRIENLEKLLQGIDI